MDEQKRKEKALLLRVDRLKNTINGQGRYKLYFLIGDILHVGLYSGYKVSYSSQYVYNVTSTPEIYYNLAY